MLKALLNISLISANGHRCSNESKIDIDLNKLIGMFHVTLMFRVRVIGQRTILTVHLQALNCQKIQASP